MGIVTACKNDSLGTPSFTANSSAEASRKKLLDSQMILVVSLKIAPISFNGNDSSPRA